MRSIACQTAVEAYMTEREAEVDSAYARWVADPPDVVRRLRATRMEQAPEVIYDVGAPDG